MQVGATVTTNRACSLIGSKTRERLEVSFLSSGLGSVSHEQFDEHRLLRGNRDVFHDHLVGVVPTPAPTAEEKQ